VVVVMFGGTGAGSIVIDRAGGVVSVSDKESVTCTVKLEVPADPGLPEITPVDGLRDRFDGNVPEITPHMNEPVPPLAAKVRL
jgi:hypothetical protein